MKKEAEYGTAGNMQTGRNKRGTDSGYFLVTVYGIGKGDTVIPYQWEILNDRVPGR